MRIQALSLCNSIVSISDFIATPPILQRNSDFPNLPITVTGVNAPPARPTANAEERAEQLNQAIMPRLTQAIVANTVASVERRITATSFGAGQAGSVSLDGHRVQLNGNATLSDNLEGGLLRKLPVYVDSLEDGTMDWKRMLSNSSFVLPLSATDSGGGSQNTGLALWGSGAYSRLNSQQGLDWDGDVFSFQLGIDATYDEWLIGSMVSWSEGDIDYTLGGDTGEYNHQMTSIHPYVAWSDAGTSVWGSIGYGQGELEIKSGNGNIDSNTDTRLLSVAAGIKGRLPQPGLSLKGDVLVARTDIEESEGIDEQEVDNQRLRLLLEIEEEYRLASGGVVAPVLEIGMRYDGGDGETGVGAVLGAGVRYANPITGVTVEGKLHTLIGQDDYSEWGVSGVISLDRGTDEHGLSFSLSPGYGDTGGNSEQVWQGVPEGNSAHDNSMRLNARLGYGLFIPGGLLTPYSEMTLGSTDSYRLGLHWKRDSLFDLKLVGERRESSNDPASQSILLQGKIHF